jgi:hypothetical protein
MTTFTNKFSWLIFAAITFSMSILNGASAYLDNYEEEARLFGVAKDQQNIDWDLGKRTKAAYYFGQGHKSYKSTGVAYDMSDKQVGDFSISIRPALSKANKRFGFMTNLWGDYPNLSKNDVLKFHLKTISLPKEQGIWKFEMIDSEGRLAKGQLEGCSTNGAWSSISLPLIAMNPEEGFSYNAIKLCQFSMDDMPKGTVIKFDFIHFSKHNGEIISVTDKTLEQQKAEQKKNKDIRIKRAFEISAKKAHKPVVSAFAMMYLDQDLKKANQILREDIAEMRDYNTWCLLTTPLYCRFYYWFSNRCGTLPGRLEPETEKQLLEAIWNRTKHKNDIQWSKTSTWYMDGSENHDLNARACNLVSSRIFMNEPEYRDRIYPNLGFGGGYHNGIAGYYGKGIDPTKRHGGGRANLSDGNPYTAKDHYKAWLRYLKEYFRERAQYGFFLENSSHIYGKHTMNMVDLIYAYGGDSELKQIVGDFITLYWADYAQTGIAGIAGGPKTRHHGKVGGYCSYKGMLAFFIGGPADAGIWNYWNIINGYELPKVVHGMLLDREGMGRFLYLSRGVGEAVNKVPRPKGTERTLIVNPKSRFLKYTYVTPKYTLGTQMDHPMAVHSHLSKSGRWHGMTVSENPAVRVVPVTLKTEDDPKSKKGSISMEQMYKNVQHKNTLIVQRCRSYTAINPDWYPIYKTPTSQGIHIGAAWDEKVEKAGWVFLRKTDVYAAIRVVLEDEAFEAEKKKKSTGTQKFFHGANDDPTVKMEERPYDYTSQGKVIKLKDLYSPVIIQSGDEQEFHSFENFINEVSAAKIALYKTVVPKFNILVFTPPGEGRPEIIFNAANMEISQVDGEYLEYEHPMTFESPYMKSAYGSGIITLEYGGRKKVLNFLSDNH